MERRWWGWRSRERGFFTLIALLVVLVIIAMLYKAQLGGPGLGGGSRAPGEGQTGLGGAVSKADATVCRNNLQQLRAAISLYQGNTGGLPPSLEALQASVSVALACPADGEAYKYDPSNGAVRCVHPGHGTY